jgi:hypothetical protein
MCRRTWQNGGDFTLAFTRMSCAFCALHQIFTWIAVLSATASPLDCSDYCSDLNFSHPEIYIKTNSLIIHQPKVVSI